ncbi:MAG: DNA polymerase I, partial [Anaerolineales bacterium]
AVIAFDTETTSTDEMSAGLVGIALATEAGSGWYVPVGHAAGAQLPLDRVVDALRGPLTNPHIPKVGHNIKYDYIMLLRHGLRVAPLSFDTMLAQWILDPASRRLGLKEMAADRLGEEMTHIEALIGKGKNQVSMAVVDIGAAAAYAAADAEATLRLYHVLRRDLERSGDMKLLEEIEMPLMPVLADMEMTGVLLDLPFFAQMSRDLGQRMSEIESEVHRLVGRTFNINSTQQLSDVLFKTLRLEPPDRTRKTASGHYSTAADVLDALSGKHPVVDLVLEHRELSKLKSTYVDALPPVVDARGRVHTSYSQTGSVTGRLSSNNPNLQNIPTRTELGRRVRNGFIATPGHVLLSVDYSQVELRIVAHMAGDQAMLDAFRHGQDIHATTAAAIYNVPLEQVTKEMRRHAKAINFGLIYGMSAFGLTRSTELTLAEAEDFVKAYFRQFPGVKRYLDGIRRTAAEQGYVETLLGRKRYFPALKGTMNPQMRNREEREAINAPIQGTAADIMKIAMIRIPAALAAAGLKAKMLLQVHDELVLECPQEELGATVRVVREVMENAYPLSIPLSTEARMGKSWGEMQVLE